MEILFQVLQILFIFSLLGVELLNQVQLVLMGGFQVILQFLNDFLVLFMHLSHSIQFLLLFLQLFTLLLTLQHHYFVGEVQLVDCIQEDLFAVHVDFLNSDQFRDLGLGDHILLRDGHRGRILLSTFLPALAVSVAVLGYLVVDALVHNQLQQILIS